MGWETHPQYLGSFRPFMVNANIRFDDSVMGLLWKKGQIFVRYLLGWHSCVYVQY